MNDFFRPTRSWNPPSFDPPPPPPPPPPSITQEEIDAIADAARERGFQEGFEEGRSKGEREGYASGLVQGREEGHREAFVAATERLQSLTDALSRIVEEIRDFPVRMGEPLVDLAYEIGARLSGNSSLDRGAFLAAVGEALARLPVPGESLRLRVSATDADTWREALESFELPFGHVVVVDEDVPLGHVFIEAGGTRVDIGSKARAALVREALGLPVA